MSGYRKEFGNRGEALACAYLLEQGYEIVDRNWRLGHLEVDIVAREGGTAHIVEVKTRAAQRGVDINELLTRGKQKALLAAADGYARQTSWVMGIQIDLVVILWENNAPTIEFYEDAVLPHF